MKNSIASDPVIQVQGEYEPPGLRVADAHGDRVMGATIGVVRRVLRIEGLVVLVASLVCYSRFGAGWGVFAATFLIPDLSFAGYLGGPRVGAITYNIAHSHIGAVASLVAAVLFPAVVPPAVGLIWCAHIGFDRALGYGLKYSAGFGFTHLGLIGRART